jgi:hypothetical protein
MNYTKPDVVALGTAKSLIDSISQKTSSTSDSNPPPSNVGPGPAYDLDE